MMNLFSVTAAPPAWSWESHQAKFPWESLPSPPPPPTSTCRDHYKNCLSQGASGFLLSGLASGQETLRRQMLLGLVLGGKVFKNSRKHFFYSSPSVQFSSVAQSCPTLCTPGSLHTSPPCPSPTPRVHPNSCPSSP